MDYKEYVVKVYGSGTKEWFINGELHREDGPAIEYADGDKLWYLNNQLHREDGPAIERANGSKYWYLNGKRLTEKEFNDRSNKTIVIDGKTYKLVEIK